MIPECYVEVTLELNDEVKKGTVTTEIPTIINLERGIVTTQITTIIHLRKNKEKDTYCYNLGMEKESLSPYSFLYYRI